MNNLCITVELRNKLLFLFLCVYFVFYSDNKNNICLPHIIKIKEVEKEGKIKKVEKEMRKVSSVRLNFLERGVADGN